MDTLLILTIIVPALTGMLALLSWSYVPAQRVVSVLGSLALLGVSGMLLSEVSSNGILVSELGGWPAPFGITLVADLFSAGLVMVTSFVGLAVVVYALGGIDSAREKFGFHALFHFMLMGINGAFVTGDIFNMYVWFEVLLIASFVLLILGNEKHQLDGGVKYVAINIISSAAFLSAIGLIYGMTGSLNLADIATSMENIRGSGMEATVAMLLLVGFGIKAALFPLYFWLPASYHTPPAPIAAIFAGLLTKVGIYSLIRTYTLFFPEPTGYTQTVLLVVAGLTMSIGVLGALVQRNVLRLLAFLVISAMGYVVMGLGFFTTLGLVGAIFYVYQDVAVKATLFLIGGVMERETGTTQLEDMGGLYVERPLLSLAFLVPAFSLAGFPPFPGFWGKLTLVQAGLEQEQWTLVAVALIVGVLTLLAVAQVWSRAFWTPSSEEGLVGTDSTKTRMLLQSPIVALAVALFAFGIYAQPLYSLAQRAAATLIDTTPYIEAVLG